MSGLSESKQTHVHLKNVDATTLQIIITYAYTGNLAISDSTVEPLYETACFLQVCCTERPLHPRTPALLLTRVSALSPGGGRPTAVQGLSGEEDQR